MAEVATVVDENVNGVRVVKGFAAEEREVNKLAKAAQRLRWASIEQADARARWGPLMENLPRFGLAAVLLFGGWLVIEGQVTIGALVAFNAYVVLMQAPFRFLGFIILLGQRAAASAGRLYEILDERPVIVDRPGAVDLVDPAGVVEFRDVTFGYARQGTDAGALLACSSQPGETVAFVGRTGSGKSTVARLLLRFYDVDRRSGACRRPRRPRPHGRQPASPRRRRARRALPVLRHDPGQHRLRAAPTPSTTTSWPPPRPRRPTRSSAACPSGYDTVIGERGYDLSGGQRQRISIARTLLANPTILVLDDATSAVDVKVEERIHAALRKLLAGRTTLVIAHRLSTIALADRVVLLEGGRVVAVGHARRPAGHRAPVRRGPGPLAEEDAAAAVPATLASSSRTSWRRSSSRTAPTRRPSATARRRRAGWASGSTQSEAPDGLGWRPSAGAGFAGPSATQSSAAAGLPFAGVPQELEAKAEQDPPARTRAP